MPQARYKGTVKWFNTSKGFGFIGQTGDTWPNDSGQDIFVHYTGIAESGYRRLNEGDLVEFSVEEGQKGKLQAVRVVNLSNNEKTDSTR